MAEFVLDNLVPLGYKRHKILDLQLYMILQKY